MGQHRQHRKAPIHCLANHTHRENSPRLGRHGHNRHDKSPRTKIPRHRLLQTAQPPLVRGATSSPPTRLLPRRHHGPHITHRRHQHHTRMPRLLGPTPGNTAACPQPLTSPRHHVSTSPRIRDSWFPRLCITTSPRLLNSSTPRLRPGQSRPTPHRCRHLGRRCAARTRGRRLVRQPQGRPPPLLLPHPTRSATLHRRRHRRRLTKTQRPRRTNRLLMPAKLGLLHRQRTLVLLPRRPQKPTLRYHAFSLQAAQRHLRHAAAPAANTRAQIRYLQGQIHRRLTSHPLLTTPS